MWIYWREYQVTSNQELWQLLWAHLELVWHLSMWHLSICYLSICHLSICHLSIDIYKNLYIFHSSHIVFLVITFIIHLNLIFYIWIHINTFTNINIWSYIKIIILYTIYSYIFIGKTTLLDVLSGRKNTGEISGNIYLNGKLKDDKTFRKLIGYVEQFDTLSPHDTPKEAIEFSAALRLSLSNNSSILPWVDNIITMLELNSIQHYMIGTVSTGK